jgi:hypothetical protein
MQKRDLSDDEMQKIGSSANFDYRGGKGKEKTLHLLTGRRPNLNLLLEGLQDSIRKELVRDHLPTPTVS